MYVCVYVCNVMYVCMYVAIPERVRAEETLPLYPPSIVLPPLRARAEDFRLAYSEGGVK